MRNALGTASYYWLLAKESYESPPYLKKPCNVFKIKFCDQSELGREPCLKIPEFYLVNVIKGKNYTSGLSVDIGIA